jgi:hypothetical protein
MATTAFGVPGFFVPRVPPPYLAPDGSPGALSVYDTAPLKETLEELVDFDLINRKEMRLSVGAVDIHTGNSVYFDNQRQRIKADHIMASGALRRGSPWYRRSHLLMRRRIESVALVRARRFVRITPDHAGRPVQRARRLPKNLDEAFSKVYRNSSRTRPNMAARRGARTSAPRWGAPARATREANTIPDPSSSRRQASASGITILPHQSRSRTPSSTRRTTIHASDGAPLRKEGSRGPAPFVRQPELASRDRA